MSFMTERKAQEVLKAQLAAEIAGRNTEARDLEKQLNDAGWYITFGPDGTTVKRKDKEGNNLNFNTDYAPKESSYQPYNGTSATQSNKGLWIALGIVAGIATLIAIIVIIRKYRNARAAKLS